MSRVVGFLAAISLLSLLIFEYYIYTNLNGFGFVHRNQHLLGFVLFNSLILLLVYGFLGGKIVIKKSIVMMLIFVAYFFFRVALGDDSSIWSFFFGSDSGILYYFIVGVSVSILYRMLNAYIYRNRQKKCLLGFILFIAAVYSIFPALLVMEALGNVRVDILLVEDGDELYQWLGDLTTVRTIVVSALYASVIINLRRDRSIYVKMVHLFLASLYTFQIGCSILYLQIVGSNKGTVLVLTMFCIVFLLYFFARHGFVLAKFRTVGKVWVTTSCIRIISLSALKVLVVLSCVIVIVVLDPLNYEFPFDKIRLTGFGSGEISSVTSRIELLETKFVRQFSLNPVFGTIDAEVEAGYEKGEYVHSVAFYLLSHTGLVGFLLFLLGLKRLVKELMKPHSTQSRTLVNSIEVHVIANHFALLVLLSVLFWGILSSSILWGVMWFVFGFLAQLVNHHYE